MVYENIFVLVFKLFGGFMISNEKRDRLFRSGKFRVESYDCGNIIDSSIFLGSDGRVLIDRENNGNFEELGGKLSLQFNTGFKDENGTPIFAHDKVIDKSLINPVEGYVFNIYGDWVACFEGVAPMPLNECSCYLEVVGAGSVPSKNIGDECLDILVDIYETLYGKNMGISGWHLNGDLEGFDNFADEHGWFDLLESIAKDNKNKISFSGATSREEAIRISLNDLTKRSEKNIAYGVLEPETGGIINIFFKEEDAKGFIDSEIKKGRKGKLTYKEVDIS